MQAPRYPAGEPRPRRSTNAERLTPPQNLPAGVHDGVPPQQLKPRRRIVIRAALAPAVLAGVYALSVAADRIGIPVRFCLAKRLFGIPCPGCGITTSIAALLHGDFELALRANAAGPAVAGFFVVQLALVIAAATDALREQSILRWLRVSDSLLLIALMASWPANASA
jgi:Protein of unknown function (DUF2752)